MAILSEIILVKSQKDINEIRDVHAFALLAWINTDIEVIRKTNQPAQIITEHFGKQRKWFLRTMTTLINQGFATYEKVISDDNIYHKYQVSDIRHETHMSHVTPKMSHVTPKMSHVTPKMSHEETGINAQTLPEVAGTSTPHGSNLTPSIIYKDIKRREGESAGAREEIEVETGFVPHQKNHTKFFDPLTSNHQNEYSIREFLQENYLNKLPRTPKQWAEANQPGVMAWVTVTQTDFDWYQAPLINERLGQKPDNAILETVWQNWTGYGYRPSSIGKILDWYDIVVKDPTATPWKNQGAKAYDQRHSGTNGRAKEGWHGLATSKDKPGTGSKPDIKDLNLPPLIID